MLKKIIKAIVFKTGALSRVYLKFCKLTNQEYVEYLKCYGGFYDIGDDCHINKDTRILNPEYTKIGNNVCLSSCTLIGHDASIMVLNKAYGKKLDAVGKIEIDDHVFVGMGAIILPNVHIGSKSIVAAGAVVTSSVPAGSVVAGVPAKVIGKTDELVEKLELSTKSLPWYPLIEAREGAYDAKLEPQLKQARKEYFFDAG